MAEQQTVVRASPAQTADMAHAMARAFFDEPNFTYLLPDARVRGSVLRWVFGVSVMRLGERHGEVYTTPAAEGGAVWTAPGRVVDLWGAVQAGMLALPLRMGWGGA